MNTAFRETILVKKIISFRNATALGLIAILLLAILAFVAWTLSYEMMTVILLSTLPGIGLFMILGRSQEETE